MPANLEVLHHFQLLIEFKASLATPAPVTKKEKKQDEIERTKESKKHQAGGMKMYLGKDCTRSPAQSRSQPSPAIPALGR